MKTDHKHEHNHDHKHPHSHLPEDESPHSSDSHAGHNHGKLPDADEENKRVLNMVTLYFSCRHLINLDLTSKTDPFIKCYIREDKCPDWSFVG